jgi:hypothetical protein
VRTSFRKVVEVERLQGRNVLPGNAQYLIHCDQREGIKSSGQIARIQTPLFLIGWINPPIALPGLS